MRNVGGGSEWTRAVARESCLGEWWVRSVGLGWEAQLGLAVSAPALAGA